MGDNSICGETVVRFARKERARLVPAAAVKPALRVVSMFIELKAFVACFCRSLLKSGRLTVGLVGIPHYLGTGDGDGIPQVRVKSNDLRRTTSGEGGRRERARR